MKCPSCGGENEDEGRRFCSYCGAPLEPGSKAPEAALPSSDVNEPPAAPPPPAAAVPPAIAPEASSRGKSKIPLIAAAVALGLLGFCCFFCILWRMIHRL